MDDLENQLKYMYFPTSETNYYLPNWVYYLLGAIGISLIVVGLLCFKCRQRIKNKITGLWNAKGSSGDFKLSVLPSYQEARDRGAESRTMTSSAPPQEPGSDVPLLPRASPETTQTPLVERTTYPKLELITGRLSTMTGSAPLATST